MHSKLKTRAKRHNAKVQSTRFKPLEWVLIRAEPVSNKSEEKIRKFFHLFEGPYQVKERKGVDTYVLSFPNGKIRGIFHKTNLRPYHHLPQGSHKIQQVAY